MPNGRGQMSSQPWAKVFAAVGKRKACGFFLACSRLGDDVCMFGDNSIIISATHNPLSDRWLCRLVAIVADIF